VNLYSSGESIAIAGVGLKGKDGRRDEVSRPPEPIHMLRMTDATV